MFKPEIKFTINSLKSFQEETKKCDELLKQIRIEFERQVNIATINVTKDIINNVIINKLNALIDQTKNSEVIKLIQEKKQLIDLQNSVIKGFENEKESILSIITSNLKQKKRVTKLTKASSQAIEADKYIAYVSSSTSEYQEILTSEDDINLAIRFLQIENQLKDSVDRVKQINEEFQEKIKALNINYIENDFSEELNVLSKYSKFSYLFDLVDLDPEKSYLLYGNEDDYVVYESSMKKIQELNKELNKILNE